MSATSANANPRGYFIQASSYSDATGTGGATHFTTNQYNLYLPFSNFASFETAYGTQKPKFRTKIYDVAGRTLYDEYEITFTYECRSDKATMTALTDQIYQFGQGALALITPVVSHTYTSCPWTYTVATYFDGFGTGDLWKQYDTCGGCLAYFISAFNTATGVVTITSSGTKTTANDLKPQTIYQMKITYTSLQSRDAQGVVSDIF